MAGLGEGLRSGGVLGIVILILAIVGNSCNWIAFITNAWARQFIANVGVNDQYTGYGLWRYCSGGGATNILGGITCSYIDGTNVAHYGAIQALVTIGFLGFNGMFIITLLRMFTSLFSTVGDIDIVNGIQAIVTGTLYLTGIIVFGVKYGDGSRTESPTAGVTRNGDLGYSFIVSIFAMFLQLVVGVLLLVMALMGRSGAGGKKKTKI